MAELGLPFRGKIWYFDQTDYDTDPTDGDTTYPISCKVLDVRVGIGDKHKELRGIESPNVCHLLEQTNDYTLHLEYIPQCDDTLLAKSANRDANGYCDVVGFCVGANTNLAAAADKTYFKVFGCKPKTVRISASTNNEYVIAIDYSVKSIVTDTSEFGSEPAALSGAYLAFNVAGSITKGGSDFAYIVDSIDITIDQGLSDHYDHDSLEKQFCVEGEFNIEGTVDVSLDEAGGVHFAEVVNQDEFDVVIDLGGSTCPRITIPNCKWKRSEIDINNTGEPMMESAPFTGKPTDGDLDSIVGSTP